LSEDFIYLFVPFFFGILFVEDTKLLILETNAAEAEGAGFAKHTIEH
jgi:hypothetical protein